MTDPTVQLSRRLHKAKKSYVTRHFVPEDCQGLLSDVAIDNGDLLLARVKRVRQHTRLELVSGRRAHLYPEDELILAAGRRYASDQFTAELPAMGNAHLVAAGGIAARMVNHHAQMKPATEIEILGVLVDDVGASLNLRRFAPLPQFFDSSSGSDPITLLVAGSGMNSGKTTLASTLVSTLSRQGKRVMACKMTGTGSGPDVWRFIDAGATIATDFTDAGLSGTWQHPPEELIDIAKRFAGQASEQQIDYLIMELADGFLQQETQALLHEPRFRELFDGCFVAADCTPSALMLVQLLASLDLPVLGISGAITRAPLLIEEIQSRIGLPVPTIQQLMDAENLNLYLGTLGFAR